MSEVVKIKYSISGDSVCLKYQIYGFRAVKLVISQGNTEDLQIFFRHYRFSKIFAREVT